MATWNELPVDILSRIFSYLSPDSLARAMCVCHHWFHCSRLLPLPPPRYPPWFLAIPSRSNLSPSVHGSFCYACEPELGRWYSLPLDFISDPLRLVAAAGGLLLCKLAASPTLRLVLCNPFTRRYRFLPDLLIPRSNPAIGVVVAHSPFSPHYSVVVAGGASGASYEPTMEVYDLSGEREGWCTIGPMPMEFAVRLTVWTPQESVHTSDDYLYWMTSARAYSVVGFDVARRTWREVKLPMADRLDWAALFRRSNGRLGLIGGGAEGSGRVWELRAGDEWAAVGSSVPAELKTKLLNGGINRSSIKYAGVDESVYLYRDLGSEMLVWRERGNGENGELNCGWEWVEASCGSVPSIPFFKAVLIHPSLSHSLYLLHPWMPGLLAGSIADLSG